MTAPAAEFAAPAASAPVSPVEVTKVSIATPAIADVASPQTAAAYGLVLCASSAVMPGRLRSLPTTERLGRKT